MGANDAAEMLEAAKAECVRLERELAVETSKITRASKVLSEGVRLRDTELAASRAHNILTETKDQTNDRQ